MPNRRDPEARVIHPAYIRMICDLLEREGGDANSVLAQVDLTREALGDGAPMLTLRVMRWLLLAAERAGGRPTLGLEAGSQVPLSGHGRLGDALGASADLRQALDLLVRLVPSRTRIYVSSVHPARGGLHYRINPQIELAEVRRFVLEHIASGHSRLLREAGGGPLDGAHIELPWPRPPWHAGVLRCCPPPRYDAAALAWFLPDALLERPNPKADAAACARAVSDCEAEMRRAESFAVQLHGLLASAEPSAWTLELAAAQLELSSRTVIRRLKAEQSDFRSIVDALRSARALAWLRDTDRPVAEIALALGYRSASNFSRSCRRWHGLNPAELRAGQEPPSQIVIG